MVCKGRVLIADDEGTFLKSTADLLGFRGYECDCAMEAGQAAKLLCRHRYDLLISDIKMPGNFNLELINQVRKVAQGMPVILVTGYPSLQTAIDSIGLPVSAYLIKPIDFEQLLLKVQQCMTRSQVFHSVREAQEQLAKWCRDLESAESLLEQPCEESASEPVNAFVALNLKNVAGILDQYSRLTGALTEGRSEKEKWELVASAQLDTAYNALTEAIGVLEQTKTLFKSKQLAQLRRKLQVVVDGWKKGRNNQVA